MYVIQYQPADHWEIARGSKGTTENGGVFYADDFGLTDLSPGYSETSNRNLSSTSLFDDFTDRNANGDGTIVNNWTRVTQGSVEAVTHYTDVSYDDGEPQTVTETIEYSADLASSIAGGFTRITNGSETIIEYAGVDSSNNTTLTSEPDRERFDYTTNRDRTLFFAALENDGTRDFRGSETVPHIVATTVTYTERENGSVVEKTSQAETVIPAVTTLQHEHDRFLYHNRFDRELTYPAAEQDSDTDGPNYVELPANERLKIRYAAHYDKALDVRAEEYYTIANPSPGIGALDLMPFAEMFREHGEGEFEIHNESSVPPAPIFTVNSTVNVASTFDLAEGIDYQVVEDRDFGQVIEHSSSRGARQQIGRAGDEIREIPAYYAKPAVVPALFIDQDVAEGSNHTYRGNRIIDEYVVTEDESLSPADYAFTSDGGDPQTESYEDVDDNGTTTRRIEENFSVNQSLENNQTDIHVYGGTVIAAPMLSPEVVAAAPARCYAGFYAEQLSLAERYVVSEESVEFAEQGEQSLAALKPALQVRYFGHANVSKFDLDQCAWLRNSSTNDEEIVIISAKQDTVILEEVYREEGVATETVDHGDGPVTTEAGVVEFTREYSPWITFETTVPGADFVRMQYQWLPHTGTDDPPQDYREYQFTLVDEKRTWRTLEGTGKISLREQIDSDAKFFYRLQPDLLGDTHRILRQYDRSTGDVSQYRAGPDAATLQFGYALATVSDENGSTEYVGQQAHEIEFTGNIALAMQPYYLQMCDGQARAANFDATLYPEGEEKGWNPGAKNSLEERPPWKRYKEYRTETATTLVDGELEITTVTDIIG